MTSLIHRLSNEEPQRRPVVALEPPSAIVKKARKAHVRKRRMFSDKRWIALLSPLIDGGLTQAEIAEKVSLSRSRVSELVRRLKIGTRTFQRRPNACPHCGGRIKIHVNVAKGEEA